MFSILKSDNFGRRLCLERIGYVDNSYLSFVASQKKPRLRMKMAVFSVELFEINATLEPSLFPVLRVPKKYRAGIVELADSQERSEIIERLLVSILFARPEHTPLNIVCGCLPKALHSKIMKQGELEHEMNQEKQGGRSSEMIHSRA